MLLEVILCTEKGHRLEQTRSPLARCDAIGHQANQDFLSHVAPSSARNVGTTCEPSYMSVQHVPRGLGVAGFAGGTNIACAGGRNVNVAQKVLVIRVIGWLDSLLHRSARPPIESLDLTTACHPCGTRTLTRQMTLKLR